MKSVKGRTQLRVIRRVITDSWRYQDKYVRLDRLVMYAITNQDTGKRYFKVYSIIQNYRPHIISRDEIAFVRLLHKFYGEGDYYIQCWGKGRKRGMRNFWDGVISNDKKFFRRKSTFFSLNPTTRVKESTSKISGDFIGHYMRTKTPGKWWGF